MRGVTLAKRMRSTPTQANATLCEKARGEKRTTRNPQCTLSFALHLNQLPIQRLSAPSSRLPMGGIYCCFSSHRNSHMLPASLLPRQKEDLIHFRSAKKMLGE